MRRKIALLITTMLILSVSLQSLTAEYTFAANSTATQVINALGIMNTDKGNNKKGTAVVIRSRFAQMLVNMSSEKDKVPHTSNISLFSDVSKKYWAAKYIQMAVTQGWMSGYLNGSFKPEKGIKLQEAVSAVLKLLGYSSSDFSGNQVAGQMALFKSKKMNANISKTNASSYLTVNDCINLFYNTLNATNKEGKVYAATLGYAVNTENKIDYLSFVKSQTEGPVIATDNWQSKIPFTATTATYYKDGSKCDFADINEYDVLYYSENLKTIWAYDDRITGTVEEINPNTISPTSVKVAGKEYTLEGTDVTIEFSSLGNMKESDIVTLLLGKDGTAVGALKENYNTVITGVVLSKGTHLVQNTDGYYETSDYVTYVDAAGNEYDQDYDDGAVNFSKYDLIQVIYQDGKASVSKPTIGEKSFGGYTFSSDGSKLGNVTLASNVKILDLHDTNYKSINPVRLSNVTISNTQIYYYDMNKNGQISKLILENVTGDADKYGVVTKVTASANSTCSYSYDINGTKSSITLSSLLDYNANIGPKGFTFNGGSVSGSYALNEVIVYSIGKVSVQDKNTVYPLADEYSVYYFNEDDNTYVATTLDKISNLKKYRVKAYYDKLPSFGGRIRVIVAQSIN